jgi:hypothetical protein
MGLDVETRGVLPAGAAVAEATFRDTSVVVNDYSEGR